jgi:hypothetical protein
MGLGVIDFFKPAEIVLATGVHGILTQKSRMMPGE